MIKVTSDFTLIAEGLIEGKTLKYTWRVTAPALGIFEPLALQQGHVVTAFLEAIKNLTEALKSNPEGLPKSLLKQLQMPEFLGEFVDPANWLVSKYPSLGVHPLQYRCMFASGAYLILAKALDDAATNLDCAAQTF